MRVNGVQLRVRGKVQGVGFRPFVWQLAHQLGLAGDVCNDGEGVLVRLAGSGGDFTARLRQDCPPLARIDRIETQPFSWTTLPDEFVIRHSESGAMDTQIVPDAATCPACLAEMRDPRERRYRYPFINCTHCGPRFTIIRAMPYDRP
ncbi:MAG: acylphosphatase, partial [Enterobacter hormaechei]|nr:acylphosphatase [Enterobacter hormaechei]